MKENHRNKFIDKQKIFILVTIPVIISLALLYFNRWMGFVGLLLSVLTYFVIQETDIRLSDSFQKHSEDIKLNIDTITKAMIFNMPFPIAILENKRDIKWHNSHFKNLFQEKNLIGMNIKKLIPDLCKESFEKSFDLHPEILKIGAKFYELYYANVMKNDSENITLLYALDNTYDENIKKLFKDKSPVVMTIYIDNYQDLRKNTPDNDRAIVFAQIDKIVHEYITGLNGILRKYENDKYLAIVERKAYDKMYENKFSILDKIREIEKTKDIEPTLSIGVGIQGDNPLDLYNDSAMAIDIALSRGGDQAVIKTDDTLEYFGGKSKAAEKTSKVKARVISHALRKLIDNSSEVFIMGHENPDMDSFGSCLGIYEGVRSRNKKAYLVLEEVSAPIKNIYHKSLNCLEELKNNIKTQEEALDIINPSSLVIVVDNHRRNSTQAPALLEKTDQIVVIDHHRRGSDYIKEAIISYIEPYASSASELVTEMLNYFDDDFEARPVVADGLLAGITVDTKNFYYQTGVRTFEAASILKRWGADSLSVKQMFKDDFEIVRYKSEVIADSKVYMNKVAIGTFRRDMDGSTLIASQAADSLLNIEGVKASFVLTLANGKTHISGRSLGDISVQLIMEKIGGGGHLTAAATQLEKSIEEAYEILKRAIKEYFEEEKNESDTD